MSKNRRVSLISFILVMCVSCSLIACSVVLPPQTPTTPYTPYFTIEDWVFQPLQTTKFYTLFGSLDYAGDYYFDEFLEQGASDTGELLEFLEQKFPDVDVPLQSTDFGCSTFTCATEDGDRLFGRNFDLLAPQPAMLVRTPSREGVYASISMCGMGFLGYNETNAERTFDSSTSGYLYAPYVPLDGINEAGVAIAVLALNAPAVSRYGTLTDITTTTAIRLVLDYADSVEDAIDLLSQYDMHTDDRAYHFHIADSTGASAVVEYTYRGKPIVTYVQGDYQYCTNHYVGEDEDLPSVTDNDSKNRANTINSALRTTDGILDEEAAFELLDSVAKTTYTRWSAVYDLTNKSVTICLSRDYTVQYSFTMITGQECEISRS